MKNSSEPKVSIVIPTYNRAHLVTKAIESVLQQNFQNLQLIVVDDGSVDNTRDCVARFSDPRLLYLFRENGRTGAALNTGIAASRGELFAFLGSDDAYLPEFVQTHVEFLDQHPEIGLVGSGMQVVAPDGQLIRESQPWLLGPEWDVSTWLHECRFGGAAMMRRTWLDRVGGFDASLKLLFDWDLFLRLAYAGCQSACLERSLYLALQHSGRLQRDIRSVEEAITAVLDKFFSQPDLPEQIAALANSAYARGLLRAARFGYAGGDNALAADAVARAIEQDPSLLHGDDEQVYPYLLEMADSHFVKDPVGYAKAVFDHLPPAAQGLRRRRGKGIAVAAMITFFRAHRRQDWRAARCALGQALRHDPSWLCDRGVLSVSMETLLGPKCMDKARSAFRRLLGSQRENPEILGGRGDE